MTAAHWPDTAPLTYGDVVVLDYLAALWAESEDLSPDLRDELMAAVTEYIALRRTASASPITDPEQIIGRLGPPEALVAAARRGHVPAHVRRPMAAGPPAAPAPASTRAGAAEYAAVALLTGGSFVLPVVGPLAGMLLASGSSHWTPAQKAVAWVLTVGSAGIAMMMFLIMTVGYGQAAAAVLALATVVAGPILAGTSLIAGLSTRER